MVNQLIQDKRKLQVKYLQDPSLLPLGTVSFTEKDNNLREEHRLLEGFTRSGFPAGLKSFESLSKEYHSLGSLIAGRNGSDSLVNIKRIDELTTSLYSQGLHFCSLVLDIGQQLNEGGLESLTTEKDELQEELKTCSAKLQPLVTERLAKVEESLRTLKGFKEKVDEALGQAGLCKDSIREVKLDLPEVLLHTPQDEFDKALLELRTRMEFAQRVKEEYKAQGI